MGRNVNSEAATMAIAGSAVGYDAVFIFDPETSSNGVHKILEASFGARKGSGYLWSRHADGRVVCRFPYALEGTYAVSPVSDNDRLMIRARVNITKKNRDGKRRAWPIHDKSPRRAWLERRGDEHGFSVGPMAVITERDKIDHDGRSFWLDATEFTGWVTVTNAEKFNRVLSLGLSARRAWGFGLIEIIERGPVGSQQERGSAK